VMLHEVCEVVASFKQETAQAGMLLTTWAAATPTRARAASEYFILVVLMNMYLVWMAVDVYSR
jgi:hypothetical protein